MAPGYGIAPNGFLARSRDGALVAGTFSATFDGFSISPGSHDLVVSRSSSRAPGRSPALPL